MSSEPRITTSVVEHLESLIDLFERSASDRVIDLAEQRAIRAAMRGAYATSVDADEGLAIGIAQLRRGPDSERAKRLMGERRSRLRLVAKNDAVEPEIA